jgi:PST family polysaccharide transporter
LFLSSGRPDRQLRLALIITPLTVLSFVIGLPFGIRGVALSFSLFLLAIFPWTFQYTFHGTRVTLTRLGRALLWPVSIGLAAVAVSALILRGVNPHAEVNRLVTVAIALGATYILSATLIPPVRNELLRLKGLLGDLRVSRRTAV